MGTRLGQKDEGEGAVQADNRSGPSRTTFVKLPRLARDRVTGEVLPLSGRSETLDPDAPVEVRRQSPPPSYQAPKALRIQRVGVEELLVPLESDRSYLFGRAPECTVVFPDDEVSRQHGRLSFRDDNRWVYRDLNSRNRSFLTWGPPQEGGEALGHRLEIRSAKDRVVEAGDIILLANDRCRIELLDKVPEELVAGPRPRHAGSVAAARLEQDIGRCAGHHLPVFILGESGTGKTFVAREIHGRSEREGSFVLVNCARLPKEQSSLHSELLGHVKGAFTDALHDRVGKIHGADGGTLFLDEVESLSPEAQGFLLDILEGSGSLAPLGASADYREPPPHFRLISASKVPLGHTGLRRDLTQRLAMGDFITLHTLEERSEDIPNLVEAFLHRLKAEQQLDAELTSEALAWLRKAPWPGNIRELEATVKTVVIREAVQRVGRGLGLQRIFITLDAVKSYLSEREKSFGLLAVIPPKIEAPPPPSPVYKRPRDLTVEDLQAALARHGGKKSRAARELGIALNTLKARMKALGLE